MVQIVVFMTFKYILTIISIVPLEILVGMLKAWKKDVFSGLSPVFWAGTITLNGAIAPALAGALTLFSKSLSLTSIDQVSASKNETNVSANMRQKFFQSSVTFNVTTNCFSHHSVFPHQYNSVPTKGHTYLLHLLGADIVGTHDETFWVIVQKLLQKDIVCHVNAKWKHK